MSIIESKILKIELAKDYFACLISSDLMLTKAATLL